MFALLFFFPSEWVGIYVTDTSVGAVLMQKQTNKKQTKLSVIDASHITSLLHDTVLFPNAWSLGSSC